MIHVTANSKEVRPGSIFFALQGAKFDGHDFIDDAIRAGASTIYSERDLGRPDVIPLGDQARKKLGELASEMYGHPTQNLVMIGVTGTSGKTTTSYLIEHLLNECGSDLHLRCARIGTNGAHFDGKLASTINTTPDAISLQKWFKEVLDQGATHVVMEVSSHALQQDRVWGIAWDAAVFLNLSPEHLDYHPTLDQYFEAKARLFTDHFDFSKQQGKHPRLFANVDNEYGRRLVQEQPQVEAYSPQGTDPNSIQCPLFGAFQLENILAALQVVKALVVPLGVPSDRVVKALSSFPGVPGRMEAIANMRGIHVFVDYAHKPEALEKVLSSIQGKRIITVFGCGGDRDKTKRPVMGAIAARLSDELILTSDNPRTEDPLVILGEIEAGVKLALENHSAKIASYRVIADRAEAIRAAVALAHAGDLVLIAGKGHETYQIFGSEKRHFDDREEARKALA